MPLDTYIPGPRYCLCLLLVYGQYSCNACACRVFPALVIRSGPIATGCSSEWSNGAKRRNIRADASSRCHATFRASGKAGMVNASPPLRDIGPRTKGRALIRIAMGERHIAARTVRSGSEIELGLKQIGWNARCNIMKSQLYKRLDGQQETVSGQPHKMHGQREHAFRHDAV